MTGARDPGDAAATLRRQADAHADLGRWTDALAGYVEAFACDATDAHSACRIVDGLNALRRTGDAIVAAERAVEHFPDHAPAFNALGNALDGAGRAAAAVAAFERAIELEPNAAYLHRNLARAAWKVPDFPRAITAARQGLTLEPDDARSFQALGYVLLQAGEPAEAATWLTRGLAIDPESTVMMNNLGRARAATGELDEAEALFRDVMRIRPQDDETRRELLSVMVRRRVATDGPGSAVGAVHEFVGFFRRLGLEDGVEAHVVANSLRVAADLLDELGDVAGALAVAQDGTAHAEAVAAAGRTRYLGTAVACRCATARLLTRLARHDEAVAEAERAVEGAHAAAGRHPVDEAGRLPQALYQLAQSLGAAARPSESVTAAVACVEASRALAEDDRNRSWWLRWSLCLCSDRFAADGRLEEAVTAGREAAEVARATWVEGGAGEQRRAYADELGHLADHLLAAGDTDEATVCITDAVNHFRAIVAERPEHRRWLADKLTTLGDCHARRGDTTAARAALDEAIELLGVLRGEGVTIATQDQSTGRVDELDAWLDRATALRAAL